MHSWRALVAIEADFDPEFTANYRLTEPWDSPHNRQFQTKMPEQFACPLCSKNDICQGITTYYGIRRSRHDDEPLLPDRGDVASCVLLAESHVVRANWLAPIDLDGEDVMVSGSGPVTKVHACGDLLRLAQLMETPAYRNGQIPSPIIPHISINHLRRSSNAR